MRKENSLFYNFIFNFIKTLNAVLFPVITFAYSSRILGVEGIGRVNFAKSTITYFTMLAMLGMNYYGTREAAKLRNDKEKLSQFCVEMLLINAVTTLMAYGLLAVFMLLIPFVHEYDTLLLICSASIVLQSMSMEWLYQALEEYRYIAVRSTLFQICSLIAMPIFVRNKNDMVPYAIITVASSSGSYILNFINARKYLHLHYCMRYTIRKHLKPLLWLFALAASIELYTVLDTTMLGFLKGDTAVGLYTAAIKVERLANTLITSIGVVLIPRLSFYISQGKRKKIVELIDKGYNYVFMMSIPAAVGLFMLSDDIILLFSGSQFVSAGYTMRLLVPIVILIPFSMMTNQQTFVPMGKEKFILISTSVGAAVNFTLNIMLIPRYAENGAAAATVIAETVVAFVCFVNMNTQFQMKFFFRNYYQYWLAAIPIPIIALIINDTPLSLVFKIVFVVFMSSIEYAFLLRLMKNPYFIEVWYQVCRKISRERGDVQ